MRRIIAWLHKHRFSVGATALLIGTGLLLAFAIVILGNFDEQRRFAAVEPGMTEEQVLAVIGKPPGRYGPPGARYGRSMWFG